MVRDGVKGRGGVDLTANAALKVWQRVCRDVQARASVAASASGTSPRPKPPSRLSTEWRPMEVARPRAPGTVPDRYSALIGLPGGAAVDPLAITTVDEKGEPLAPGFVHFRGKAVLERVALALRTALLEAKEMDRGK